MERGGINTASGSGDSIMTLTEIAGYLKVSEKTITRMAQGGKLPGCKVSNQWRFMKAAIDDWLMARMQMAPSESLVSVVGTTKTVLPLPRLISPSRILMNMKSASKESVLNQLAAPLLGEGMATDAHAYLTALFDREKMVSTAIGDGVAVPHARIPEEAGLRENCIVLGICREGMDYGSLDGKPTHLFFLVGSTTTEAHLQLMAKTMLLLRVDGLRDALIASKDKGDVRQLLMSAHEDLTIRL